MVYVRHELSTSTFEDWVDQTQVSPAALGRALIQAGSELVRHITEMIPSAAATPLFKIRTLHQTEQYESLDRPSRLIKLVEERYLSCSDIEDSLLDSFPITLVSRLSFGVLAEPVVDPELLGALLRMVYDRVNMGIQYNPTWEIVIPLSEDEVRSSVPDVSCLTNPAQIHCWRDLHRTDDPIGKIKLNIILISLAQAQAADWGDRLTTRALAIGW